MGRRTPRQTPETAQLVHDREGFLGALRGRTNVPIPVGRDANSLARSRAGGAAASAVRAYQDVFTLTGVADETVELTYLPLTYSEHTYLNGVYQQEGADYDWTRESGARTVTIKDAMDARSGDILIVEYLYYAGTPGLPVEAPKFPAGVFFHYKLDETSGSVASDETGNWDGAYSGTYTLGQAALNGDGGYSISCNAGGLVTNQFVGAYSINSLGWWMKRTGAGGNSTFQGVAFNGWGVYESSSRLGFGNIFTYVAIDTGVDLYDGEPHHIVTVTDGGTLTLYVDGEAVGSAATGATFGSITGGWNTGNYVGWMDDVAGWLRALSPTEIAAWYQTGIA